MSRQYESTYEGQLEQCQDQRAALEEIVNKMTDEIKELQVEIAKLEHISKEFASNLKTALNERDEARREVCKRVESASCLSDGEPTTTASDYARWCGWDCFKEDGK